MPPSDQGIRVDTALYSGYLIPQFYDSLIAKIISHGNNRRDAIDRMIFALSTLRISGVPTSIPFHASALRDGRFLDGTYDTSFIENVKSFSSKDGELAAAILSMIPRRTRFKMKYMMEEEYETHDDAWNISRFDWADPYVIHHRQSFGWNI
jgi:acetyl/propionyl-CoA carboxylase alpha subunit